MQIKSAVKQVIESGIKPIVLDMQRVIDFSGEIKGVRTSLVVKSLSLGTLTANEYRYVARRTVQGSKLVERNVEKLFCFYDEIKAENAGAEFYSISVYARSLLDGQLYGVLTEYFKKHPNVEPEKICLELSADILFEDITEYKKQIEIIKQLGVKIALCEVGDEFCPFYRISEINADVVFLDGYTISCLNDEKKELQVLGAMNIITACPIQVYCSCVKQEDLPLIERLGVDGYTLKEDDALVEDVWRVCGRY